MAEKPAHPGDSELRDHDKNDWQRVSMAREAFMQIETINRRFDDTTHRRLARGEISHEQWSELNEQRAGEIYRLWASSNEALDPTDNAKRIQSTLWQEDWGEGTFRPPCGHDAGGKGRQIPREATRNNTWVCGCGLKIEVRKAENADDQHYNWDSDTGSFAIVTYPDGREQLFQITGV